MCFNHGSVKTFLTAYEESSETKKGEDYKPRNTPNTRKLPKSPPVPFRVFGVFRGLILLLRFSRVRLTPPMETEIIFKEESYKIVGACYEVYREKGCGFVEPVYQECLEIEMQLQGIVNSPQKPLALEYKGRVLSCASVPDFTCYDKIILELKAVTELNEEHRAQVQNYLKATRFTLGLLVNFGHYPKIQIER